MSRTKRQAFNWPEQQEKDYLDWQAQGGLAEICSTLLREYDKFQKSQAYHSGITFLNRPLQKGIFMNLHDLEWPVAFGYQIMYHLYRQITGLDYVKHLMDIQSSDYKKDYMLYFKPSIKRLVAHPERHLLYGNMTLKASAINSEIETIRLQADRYAQRGDHYDSFDDMMNYLFSC